MHVITIDTFDDDGQFAAVNLEEFDAILDRIHAANVHSPILVQVELEGLTALLGLGSEWTTIEAFSADRTKHIRSGATVGSTVGEAIQFTYFRQWSRVPAKYLIPTDIGRRAIHNWLQNGVLIDDVTWIVSDHPPGK